MRLRYLEWLKVFAGALRDRFADCQAQWLNVHVDFPLLQRLALPVTIGTVRYPGIKIHGVRLL